MSGIIQSVLQEDRLFPPSPAFVQQANISGMAAYEALCAEAERDHLEVRVETVRGDGDDLPADRMGVEPRAGGDGIAQQRHRRIAAGQCLPHDAGADDDGE